MLREVIGVFRDSLAARVASVSMILLFVVALAIGAAEIAHAEELIPKEARDTVAILLAVAGFGGGLLAAGAGVVVSWTATRMQQRQQGDQIRQLSLDIAGERARHDRELARAAVQLENVVSTLVHLGSDVAEMKGWIKARGGFQDTIG